MAEGAFERKLRSCTRLAGFGAWTMGMLGGVHLHQAAVKEADRYLVWQRWMKGWTRGLLRFLGTELFFASPLPQPAQGARLVVSNHRSPLDIAIMLTYFGGHVLSRHDLAHWPLIGLAARRSETIFVDRTDAHSGISAIREIRNRLKRSQTIIVFPEGGTFEGDEVRPFHEGAFATLRGLDVELLPVGVAYERGAEFVNETFVQHFVRVGGRSRTQISICFGQGRAARGNHKSLANEMHNDVQQQVYMARETLRRSQL